MVGVGFIAALNVTTVRYIIASWLVTVPLAAGLAALLFGLCRLVLL